MTSLPLVVLATQNAKKGRELQELLAGKLSVQTLADLGLAPEIIEDKPTFAGNAQRKAEQVLLVLEGTALDLSTVHAVLADDSGLIVDALDGGPGVRSARFASDHAAGEGDDDNNALLLRQMEAVPTARRTARFACALCVLFPAGGQVREAFATVEGKIAADLQGAGGFGYDPLFIPDAHPARRMAELSAVEKHAISHRGQAMRTALPWLLAETLVA